MAMNPRRLSSDIARFSGRLSGRFCALFLVSWALFLASCAQASPEIKGTSIQLLRVQSEAGTFAERLSVYAFLDDADGVEDFGSITVTHAETSLAWTITPDNALVRLMGKDRWTGSSSLAGPGDTTLPAGEYSLTVADLAGNETVRPFTLRRPAFPQYAPVKLEIKDGHWVMTRSGEPGEFTRIFFFLLDGQGLLAYSWRLPDYIQSRYEGEVSTLRSMSAQVAAVQCFVENADGSAGVLLTPVDIR